MLTMIIFARFASHSWPFFTHTHTGTLCKYMYMSACTRYMQFPCMFNMINFCNNSIGITRQQQLFHHALHAQWQFNARVATSIARVCVLNASAVQLPKQPVLFCLSARLSVSMYFYLYLYLLAAPGAMARSFFRAARTWVRIVHASLRVSAYEWVCMCVCVCVQCRCHRLCGGI